MFKELVKSIIRYKKDKCILSLQLSENLKKNIQEDLIAAYEISEPLVNDHVQKFRNSSSFLNFLIDILNISTYYTDEQGDVYTTLLRQKDQQLDDCKKEIDQLKLEICPRNEKDDTLKLYEELKQCNIEINRLNNLVRDLKMNKNNADDHFRVINNNARDVIKRLESENQTLKNQFSSYQTDMETCEFTKARILSLEGENQKLKDYLINCESDLQGALQSKQLINADLENSTKTHLLEQQLSQCTAEINSKTGQMNQLNAMYENLRQQLSDRETQYNTLKIEYEKLMKEFEDYNKSKCRNQRITEILDVQGTKKTKKLKEENERIEKQLEYYETQYKLRNNQLEECETDKERIEKQLQDSKIIDFYQERKLIKKEFKEENERLENRLKVCQEENERMEKKMKSLIKNEITEYNLKNCQEENEALKSQLNFFKKENEKIKNQLTDLYDTNERKHLIDCQEENKMTENNLKSYKEIIKENEKRLNDCEEQNEVIQKQLNTCVKNKIKMTNELKISQKENELMRQQLQEFEKENKANENLEKVKEERDSCKLALEKCVLNLAELKSSKHHYEDKTWDDDCRDQLKKYEKDSLELHAILEKYGNVENESELDIYIQKTLAEMCLASGQINVDALNQINYIIDPFQENNSPLIDKIKTFKNELDTLKRTNVSLNKIKLELENALGNCEKRIEEGLEEDNMETDSTFRKKIYSLKKRLQLMKREKIYLSHQLDKCKNDVLKYQNKILNHSQEIVDLEKNKHSNEEFNLLLEKIKNLELELNTFKKMYNECISEKEDLKEDVKNLNKIKVIKKEDLTDEISVLKLQLQTEKQQYQERENELNNKISFLHKDISSLKLKSDSFKKMYNDCISENEDLKETVKTLNKINTIKTEDPTDDIRVLKLQFQKEKEQYQENENELNNKISLLHKNISSLELELNTFKKMYNECISEKEDLKEDVKNSNKIKTDEIRVLKQQLQKEKQQYQENENELNNKVYSLTKDLKKCQEKCKHDLKKLKEHHSEDLLRNFNNHEYEKQKEIEQCKFKTETVLGNCKKDYEKREQELIEEYFEKSKKFDQQLDILNKEKDDLQTQNHEQIVEITNLNTIKNKCQSEVLKLKESITEMSKTKEDMNNELYRSVKEYNKLRKIHKDHIQNCQDKILEKIETPYVGPTLLTELHKTREALFQFLVLYMEMYYRNISGTGGIKIEAFKEIERITEALNQIKQPNTDLTQILLLYIKGQFEAMHEKKLILPMGIYDLEKNKITMLVEEAKKEIYRKRANDFNDDQITKKKLNM